MTASTVEIDPPIHSTTKEYGWKRWGASAIVATSFLPYLAIPVGENSNVPVVAFLGGIALLGLLDHPRIFAFLTAVVALPFVSLFTTMLLSGDQPTMGSIQASVLWGAQVSLPMAAWVWATIRQPRATFITLNIAIALSSSYAIVQSFFIRAGILPFANLYGVPGYWDVAANVDTILRYIRRPFGWFPEPSFMAGSLALACVLMVILACAQRRTIGMSGLLTLALATAALIISVSGAAALALVLLSAVVLLAKDYFPGGRWILVPALIVAILASKELIDSRSATTVNYSWDDRLASFGAPLRYILSEPVYWLSGLGKGAATVLAKSGDLDYAGFSALHRTEDVVSVIGRLVIENGLFGLMFVAILSLVVFITAVRLLGYWSGVAAGVVWIVVAGPTVSYDSAVMIWALPAACIALMTVGLERKDAVLGKKDA